MASSTLHSYSSVINMYHTSLRLAIFLQKKFIWPMPCMDLVVFRLRETQEGS